MKPILFSTPMVQAIQDNRKSQTRRVIADKDIINNWSFDTDGKPIAYIDRATGDRYAPTVLCRYQTGMTLWVRETWARISDWTCVDPEVGMPDGYIYCADWEDTAEHPKWHPSIHMPREAARIFLRVTDVRVERIRDILCGDMRREGCIPSNVTGGQWQQWQNDYFRPLWDKLNAMRGYGWEVNPWVWVISFERVENPALHISQDGEEA